MKNEKILIAHCDEELFELAHKKAKEHERSISSLIREAVKNF